MARRKLTDTTHPDSSLDDAHWLTYGDSPQPPMRLKILYVTFEEVAKSGPMSFNVASVCDRLGITYPMINHYFGGRDALLAEAAHMVYDRFVDDVWKAVEKAPRNPKDRLAAWVRAEIEETSAMSGWSAVLNSPMAARDVSDVIYSTFGHEMRENFELNMARVGLLVQDVAKGVVTDVQLRKGRVPRAEMLADPFLQSTVPTVVWSTFGAAVWLSGQHLPSRGFPDFGLTIPQLIERHVQGIVDFVESQSS